MICWKKKKQNKKPEMVGIMGDHLLNDDAGGCFAQSVGKSWLSNHWASAVAVTKTLKKTLTLKPFVKYCCAK